MAVDQLPGRVREFMACLEGVLARLDQGGGWCRVFWQRDPDGMRACLDGREVPPWDVVEALLQDLAVEYGPEAARAEAERVRPLHAAAQSAHDDRPGGRDALGDRFDVMLREQRYAMERQAELGRLLASATTREEADALRLDLAWARDDHERATRRCAELQARMAELDQRVRGGRASETRRGQGADGTYGGVSYGPDLRATGTPAADPRATGTPAAEPRATGTPAADPRASGTPAAEPRGPGAHRAADPRESTPDTDRFPNLPRQRDTRTADVPETPREPAPAPPAPEAPAPKPRKRRRGSARFAGMAEEEGAPVVVPPTSGPDLPAAPVAKGRSPRGARFAGAGAAPKARSERSAEPVDAVDAVARRETADTVEPLVRLRAEGRTGEAHVLLVEVAHWPADRFPLLAAELQRAGLGADWATLLWEAASLPADRLVAAADALAAAGRAGDGEQVLRQGVARPAAEIGEAVLALIAEGRRREVNALLDAYVRVRAPEEAARSAEPGPRTLVPLLLAAARGVSDQRHWDLVHALRVAGFSA
ncbi:hypothetical protein [Streptomyces sp. SID13726]|uniref:hypothetical protein n=1 Tax=Streptomyces sp. SID13726 TaxID=2706058 RepID=UPI0013BA06B0|nr:hypothetical protein [Streptomyces sp. SID13726]NEA98170.1 hypothetical protein [Streptomyces sp. SID13726]